MTDTEHENFSQTALDHAHNPRNLGPLPVFNGHAVVNGGCGDLMEFWIFVRGGEMVRTAFDTNGCGSSIACGSMAACMAERRTVPEALRIGPKDILQALGGLPADHEHCAALAAQALRAACEDYRIHGFMRSK